MVVVPVINQAGFPVRSIYLNPMDGINLSGSSLVKLMAARQNRSLPG